MTMIFMLIIVLALGAWLKHLVNGVCPNCKSWHVMFRYNLSKNNREEWKCLDCKHSGIVKEKNFFSHEKVIK